MGSKGVFLREATGLVREMNTFDVLAMNSFNISAGLGLAFVLFVAPSVFFAAGPNGIPFGVLLATLGGLSGALMFAFMTAMIPRSVADYAIVTRTIHPALGFATNWTWAFWNVVWAGILTSFVSDWAMYDLFAIYGSRWNNPTLLNVAYNPTNSIALGPFHPAFWTLFPASSFLNILIGTIIIAVFGIILSVGPRVFLYFQRAVFTFGLFSLIVVLVVMASTSHDTFVTNWNAFASAQGAASTGSYVAIAANAGSSVAPGKYTIYLATLGVIPVASWSIAYGQMTTAVGGEIKRPTRTLPLGAGLSVAIAGGIMALGAFLYIHTLGLNFLSGAVNMFNGGTWPYYASPYFDLFATIAGSSPIITLIVGIGFICWIIYYPGLDCLANTRALLAWSFDRITPSFFGQVSEKYHTPIRAVALFSVLDWIALFIFSVNFTLVGSLTATLAVFLTMFGVMGVVGLIFPFLKRTRGIFEQSPFRWRVGPVPVLTLTAVGWLAFLGVGIYFYLSESALASNKPLMLLVTAVVFLAAFPIYALARWLRSRQGIDLRLAYKEIPPE
jgi:amino acid transporter